MTTERAGLQEAAPRTGAGRWLLDHQGLINIGKIDGSMRGDEIDLCAAIVTIENEAAALATPDEPGLDDGRLREAIGLVAYHRNITLPGDFSHAVARAYRSRP